MQFLETVVFAELTVKPKNYDDEKKRQTQHQIDLVKQKRAERKEVRKRQRKRFLARKRRIAQLPTQPTITNSNVKAAIPSRPSLPSKKEKFKQQSLWKRFLQTVYDGKLESIQRMVKPLKDNREIKELLTCRTTAEMKLSGPFLGWMAHHIAAYKGHMDILRYLFSLSSEMILERTDPHEQTALHLASLGGHADICQLLVDMGIPVDVLNPRRFNQTPLHIAGIKGFTQVAEVLIQNGASVSALNNNPRGGRSTLQMAVVDEHHRFVDYLLPKLTRDAVLQVENGTDALGRAVKNNNSDVLYHLIRKVGTLAGNSLLLQIARKQNPSMLRLVLDNRTFSSLAGALPAAASVGNVDMVRLLMESGATLYEQQNALNVAAGKGHLEVARLLIEAQPENVNNLSWMQESPLSMALQKRHIAVALLILNTDCISQTTLNACAASSGDSPLHLAVKTEDLSVLKAMLSLKGKVNVNIQNTSTGHTPLHLAAQLNSVDMIRELVESGANINIKNDKAYGVAPLHVAARKGLIQAVTALLQCGADPNVKKNNRKGGRTPIELAQNMDNIEVVYLLRSYGANEPEEGSQDDGAGLLPKLKTGEAIKYQVHNFQEMKDERRDHRDELPLVDDHTTKRAPWRNIRIFVSSTFRDMDAERNFLINHIFANLAKKCRHRKINLIPVDLRWGVTEEEVKTGKVLDLCLSEINNCQIFLNITGDRYGWVPTMEEIPIDTLERYNWQRGVSVTEMEVLHALKRRDSITSLFFIRDSEFISSLPQDLKSDYLESSREQSSLSERLKDTIRSSGSFVFDYQPVYDGIDPVSGKAKLTNLEDFGKNVEDQVWKLVTEISDSTPVMRDELDLERSYHEMVIHTKTRGFVGRDDILRKINEYAESFGQESKPLVVVGTPGCGKSSLMGHFVKLYQQYNSHVFVLMHFVGGSPDSTDARFMLWRLCSELKRHFRIKKEVPTEYSELSVAFSQFLNEACLMSFGKVLIVIDALNQMDETYGSHQMLWLPSQLPKGARIVVSCLEGDCYEAMSSENFPQLRFGALTTSEKRDLVTTKLRGFSRSLETSQLSALLDKTGAVDPLYLVIACEELRVFGSFERLTEKITNFASTIPTLLDQVIARLETVHGRSLVKKALCLLECSRHGLTELELLCLLKRESKKEKQLPSCIWGSLHSSLDLFLTTLGESGEGRLDFFHRQLAKAIRKRYFQANRCSYERKRHKELAMFFMSQADPQGDRSWGGVTRQCFSELPYHLTMACEWKTLSQVLTDLRFLENKCSKDSVFSVIQDYNFLLERKQPLPEHPKINKTEDSLVSSVIDFKWFIFGNLYLFSEHPELIYQQALGSGRKTVAAAAERQLNTSDLPCIRQVNSVHETSELLTLLGHHAFVNCCDSALVKDELLVASGDADGLVKIWSLRTGEEKASITAHNEAVNSVKFFKDPTKGDKVMLVSCSSDGMKIWDISTARVQDTFKHNANVLCCSVSGSTIAYGDGEGGLGVWDRTTSGNGKLEKVHLLAINGVAFSPDGQRIAAASSDKTIGIYYSVDLQKFQRLAGHNKVVQDLTWSKDGKSIFSVSQDKTLKKWDVASGKVVFSVTAHSENVNKCHLHEKGDLIATASWDKSVGIWCTKTGRSICKLRGHSHYVDDVSFVPGSSIIVTASQDHSLKAFDYKTAIASGSSPLAKDEGHTKLLCDLSYSPDGKSLVSGSWDTTIKQWTNVGEFKKTIASYAKRVNTVSYSPDGTVIASGLSDNTVKILNAESGREILQMKGHKAPVFAVAFTHDGNYVASASVDTNIALWDTESGELMATLTGHTDWACCLAFSHDSSRLISGSRDHSVKVWESQTGEELATLHGLGACVYCCNITKDDKFIIAGDQDGSLVAWDGKTMEKKYDLVGHKHEVLGVQFLGDDQRYALSASGDHSLKIWDLTDGSLVWQYNAKGQIMSLATFGERHIAVGDGSGRLYVLEATKLRRPLFEKALIKLGRFVDVQPHPRADRSYVCKIDLGSEQRTITTQLREYYRPEQLVGRLSTIIVNLPPREIRGIESTAMLFVGEQNGTPRKVELLEAPEGSVEGDRVYLSGTVPCDEQQVRTLHIDLWSDIIVDMNVSSGLLHYKQTQLVVNQKPITCPLLTGTVH